MNHLLERENAVLKEFIIPFVGLKKEIHNFDYTINSSFFQEFENSPIQESTLGVSLKLSKKSNFFELDFQIKGSAKEECDRCSDNFHMGIDIADQIIVQLGDAEKSMSNGELDIFTIPTDSTFFNVAHLIYEITVLSLPIRKNCDEDSKDGKKCNPKILQFLDENQNQKEDTTVDPRWEALLKLKKNNK